MENKLKLLEKIINYNFKKISILEKALTHKSFNNSINNEKLEFLGDRVLGLIISERLFLPYNVATQSINNISSAPPV